MKLVEFLSSMAESCPAWLKAFTPETAFDRNEFFACRIVFYPGCGYDGHPVKVFGTAHAAHCFVYVDNGLPKSSIENSLDHPFRHFKGFRTVVRRHLTEKDLSPESWQPHAAPRGGAVEVPEIQPYGFLEILERESGFGPEHGADRIAILFLGADGHASYDAMFCQKGQNPPFAILLEDHGFGGNYSSFGRGGVMEEVAKKSQRKPDLLLVAENTWAWDGYSRLPDAEGDIGGMHRNTRHLFTREHGKSTRHSKSRP